jgi:hypothetical protein
MTKHLEGYLDLSEETDREFRKDMMRVMSEVSLNPASVVPQKQEELAMFMVNELRGISDQNAILFEQWIVDPFNKVP